MNITFAPRDILQIDEARITHKNFSGEASKFNREGDRNFSLIIPNQEVVLHDGELIPEARYDEELDVYVATLTDVLINKGWNVKIKPPREEDDEPFMYLPIKVKFNDRGPAIYLRSGKAMTKLNEDTISCLDDVDILNVDLDVRPYDWEVNGKAGRTAYLQSICVTQKIDRFAARYAEEE